MCSSLVHVHLKLLGRKIKDKVTGTNGVCESVCFDLYGCVQASMNMGFDKDGKRRDSYWFDVSRLTVEGKPVMDAPDFDEGRQAEGLQGAADKPTMRA